MIDCLAAHGERPARYLDRVGLLSPRTVLAHGVWLDDDELELIAERGAMVVTNPVANLKLAVGGVFPYPRARAAGVQVGLGTDGPGSNNSLDLFADMKVFALLQKHAANDAAAIDALETWEIATGQQAPAARGRARPSRSASRPTSYCSAPARPSSASASCPPRSCTPRRARSSQTTVVAGRVLMRDGKIEGAEEVLGPRARARPRARALPTRRIRPSAPRAHGNELA